MTIETTVDSNLLNNNYLEEELYIGSTHKGASPGPYAPDCFRKLILTPEVMEWERMLETERPADIGKLGICSRHEYDHLMTIDRFTPIGTSY